MTALMRNIVFNSSGKNSTFSSPEALIRNAAGPWCPRAVCDDGELLHCNTSSYSDFPVWNS
jgi:hypothetical protein